MPKLLIGARDEIRKYASNGNTVIHAGTLLEVTCLDYKVKRDDINLPDLIIEYEICAEDIKIVRGKIVISASEIYYKVYPSSTVLT